MKIISVCNQKGGVGKTSTAVTLAAYLALDKLRVLIVDLDPQGNTTSGLGLDKQTLTKSVYHAMTEHNSIETALLATNIENLSILPSNIDLTGAEIELVNEMGREKKLQRALAAISDQFDICIIDCPPSLGLLTINALSSSHSIIIPIQCEFYALEGLGQLIRTISLVKENLNASLEIEGILMTMADNRTNLTDQVIGEVKKHFGDKVYQTVIPRSIRMAEAPSFGKPIMLYDKSCSACKKYEEFHQEFLRANSNLSKQPNAVHTEEGEVQHGA